MSEEKPPPEETGRKPWIAPEVILSDVGSGTRKPLHSVETIDGVLGPS
jgi:hypothetical protein